MRVVGEVENCHRAARRVGNGREGCGNAGWWWRPAPEDCDYNDKDQEHDACPSDQSSPARSIFGGCVHGAWLCKRSRVKRCESILNVVLKYCHLSLLALAQAEWLSFG